MRPDPQKVGLGTRLRRRYVAYIIIFIHTIFRQTLTFVQLMQEYIPSYIKAVQLAGAPHAEVV